MNSPVYYLGLSISHNSSAAIMRDGEVVAAACEERFFRKKNYVGFPRESIKYCLKKAGISGSDIVRAAYTTVENSGLMMKVKNNTEFSLLDYWDYYGEKYYARAARGEDTSDYLKWLRDDPQFNRQEEYFDFSWLTDDVLDNTKLDAELFRKECVRILSAEFDVATDKIDFIDHHECHAYYAYFGSPFRQDDCIALTLDGWGDGRNQTVWKVSDDKFEFLAESAQNDLGRVYKMATLLLGMRPDEHEFKVMGLAPYAKESYVRKAMEPLMNLSRVENMRLVSHDRPADLFSYLQEVWRDHRFDNIAGAVQLYTEIMACALFKDIVEKTGIKRFVVSGGIAMNIKMNKIIAEMPEVEKMFVCGSGGDESLSIGGCYVMNKDASTNAPLNHLYLGYDVTEEMDDFDPSIYADKFTVTEDIGLDQVAKLIADGDIVAVIRGGAEFGARALGNRSILANPGVRESVKQINEAIKNRDFWMPFALSILEEKHKDYLHNPKDLSSPFMAIGLDTKDETYQRIIAGTHPYDRSVRPQFVSKDHAPQYHALISEFEKLTGTPAMLNTSFNLHGEPIVNTIADAVRTFELSGLDHLLINDQVLLSKKQ
ncbi:carbamoyltransferase C-terminal domain-containing protein [Cohaesibacter gelatinilyticus]|uniref:Carbamoyltransferase n=1 Tax=Cohaesibacter gelatinilyticus TaxID=372072 RepID=A0A285PEG9_9HYPH|nr:carbamoyltransferase C-terminal domain-containing protein [Cohaesibacter gelatinilyticus]SNZ20134.1 carbamoyltransferase [Cohaesibacter gelatinilyticus]